jgi:hypothetical protein
MGRRSNCPIDGRNGGRAGRDGKVDLNETRVGAVSLYVTSISWILKGMSPKIGMSSAATSFKKEQLIRIEVRNSAYFIWYSFPT